MNSNSNPNQSSHGKPPDLPEINHYRQDADEVLLHASGSLLFLSLDIPRSFRIYFLTVISRIKLLSCIGLDECSVPWCFRDGKHSSFGAPQVVPCRRIQVVFDTQLRDFLVHVWPFFPSTTTDI